MEGKEAWKAAVTLNSGDVTSLQFEDFSSAIAWMEEHYGEYTAFIAAKKEGEQTN